MSRPSHAQAVFLLMLGAVLAGCPCNFAPPTKMTLQLETDGAVPPETALSQARDIVYKRLDELGFSDAEVAMAPGHRLAVRIWRLEDPERVRKLILTPALLELRLVRFPTEGDATSQEAVLGHYNGQLPPELEILGEEVRDENGKAIGTRYYAVERQPVITGRDLATVRPSRGQFGDPIIEFRLKPEASGIFAGATGSNIGKYLAIVLDQRVVSAPRINARISDYGIIEGGFTQEEAHDLVVVLRSGALPGRLTMIEERVETPGGG